MDIRSYIALTDIPIREQNEKTMEEAKQLIILELKSRPLNSVELDYLEKYFYTNYMGFIEKEVVVEIFKNLSRQGMLSEVKCRKLYEFLYAFGWDWEGYIVMRLILLEKIITISKFCEGYDFYIDGIPQFLDEPVWGNIDFRKDFDNDFE